MTRSKPVQPVRQRPAKRVAERAKSEDSQKRQRLTTSSASPPAEAMNRSDGGSNSESEDEMQGAELGFASAAAAAATSSREELSGALNFFLKRASQLEESNSAGPNSQFSSILRELKSGDGTRQVCALSELSEILSFSSEEALISFPMETFIPVLVNLMESAGSGDESSAQVVLLACRSLYNIVDILPPTARIITAVGGLPILCATLLNIEYIDVAELAVAIIEWISEDQPIQVLKAGGLQAILTFLDFFQISVQRQAANAAAMMLAPIAPPEILEQHIRPVLPNLAQLLQHSDPQVLQSASEGWRRVLDNTVAPESMTREQRGEALESLCPDGVLTNLLLQLGQGISMMSPSNSSMVAELLYILAVLTNYSEKFTREVLQQDICNLLEKLLIQLVAPSSDRFYRSGCSQLSVLGLIASLLPAVKCEGSSRCSCDQRRLQLFQANPAWLENLGQAFLPQMVTIYEASMEPEVQCLCVTLLLSLLVTCRDFAPEVIQRHLDPPQFSRFLANILMSPPHGPGAGLSEGPGAWLMSLQVVQELLEGYSSSYGMLFARHGVTWAVHNLAETPVDDAPVAAQQAQHGALMKEAAVALLAKHGSLPIGDDAILPALTLISNELRSSPQGLVPEHRSSLCSLRQLLLAEAGITAFELGRSGVAEALNCFLFPPTAAEGSCSGPAASSERLRLFLDCVARAPGALAKLVRLSVSAVRRAARAPPPRRRLLLRAGPAGAAGGEGVLPSHLRPSGSRQAAAPAGPALRSAARPGGAGSRRVAGSAGSSGLLPAPPSASSAPPRRLRRGSETTWPRRSRLADRAAPGEVARSGPARSGRKARRRRCVPWRGSSWAA